MIASPALPHDLESIVERFIAPLTMVWFSVHWLFPGRNKDDPGGAKKDPEEERIAAEGERKAANRGSFAGILSAALILIFFFRFFPASDAKEISWQAAIWALLIGAGAGILTRLLHVRKNRILEVIPNAGKKVVKHPGLWGLAVACGTALGLASLIVYYTGPPYCAPHLWLMWGFLSLLCFYRFACLFLFGD
ncbi:MAG: hypothetical protein ABSG62_00330 [Terracidiphilus sp.]|jgi:hypothetical protein